MNYFDCLYYPFSRIVDPFSLKYLLLTFDSITFLDEIDLGFRKQLLEKMAGKSQFFSTFQELADDYDMLTETNIVRVINPYSLKSRHSEEIVYATLADLSDKKFVSMASQPHKYGLPANPEKPTWDIFPSKIPAPLIDDNKFRNSKDWSKHIIEDRGKSTNWTLSYSAGSSIAINLYLASADELGLTPITTSQLHHNLVLQKVKRSFVQEQTQDDLLDSNTRKRFQSIFGSGEILRLMGELFPSQDIENITLKEIIKFRNETQELRQKFQNEIQTALRIIDSDPATPKYDKEVIQTIKNLETQFRKMSTDIANAKDKIFPSFTKAVAYGTAGGGALGALVSFLGGFSPAGVVAASALTISGAFLSETLDMWNEIKKVKREQNSSVAYLAAISNFSSRKNGNTTPKSIKGKKIIASYTKEIEQAKSNPTHVSWEQSWDKTSGKKNS